MPKQSALLLLRQSAQHLLRHLERQLRPDPALHPIWEEADSILLDSLRTLRRDRTVAPVDPQITALPLKMGGLGIPLHAERSAFCHSISKRDSQHTSDNWLERAGITVAPGGQHSAPPTPEGPYRPIAVPSGAHISEYLAAYAANRSRTLTTAHPPVAPPPPPPDTSHERLRLSDSPTCRAAAAKLAERTLTQLSAALGPLQRRHLEENAAYHARLWLRVLPTHKTLKLPDSETAAAAAPALPSHSARHNLRRLRSGQYRGSHRPPRPLRSSRRTDHRAPHHHPESHSTGPSWCRPMPSRAGASARDRPVEPRRRTRRSPPSPPGSGPRSRAHHSPADQA